MKKKFILLPLIAACLYVTLSSYSEGPAITGGINGTGSTGVTGCSCHNPSPSAATTVSVQLYDATGTTLITGGYTGGTTYKIKLSGTQTNMALISFGFQVAVVKATGAGTGSAVNAGTMSAAPSGTHLYSLSGINIFEHYNGGAYAAVAGVVSGGVETYAEMITWTAPVAGTGSVKIYGTINAVNGDHSDGPPDSWNNSSVTITEAVSVLPVTGTTTVCVNATTPLTDATAGGTWSSNNTGVATVNATGLVLGVSAGTATISYATSAGFAITTVTVNPLAVAGTISGPTSVCAGATIHLSDAASGGTWSSDNLAAATVAAGGIVHGVAAGSTNISYTVTNSCNTAAAGYTITANPLPVAGTITGGSSSICTGSSTTFSDAAAGGVWSSSNTNTATVDAGGTVGGAAAGSVLISYTVTNSCGAATATTPVTVTTVASAGSITGPAQVCVGSSIILSDGVSGGVWSSTNTNAATVSTSGGSMTGLATGVTTINYLVTTTCGTASTSTTINVDPAPVPGTITGLSTVCAGASIVLSDVASGGIWSSDNTALATVDASGVVSGVSGGTIAISYTVTNACASAAATQSVVVNPLPDAGTITGIDSVCVGSTVALTDAAGGGTWSAQNTNATVSVTGMVTGATAGFDSILYTVTNACGTTHAHLDVKIRSHAACVSGVEAVAGNEAGIHIYPNPSNGSFIIDIPGAGNGATVTITDIFGKVVETRAIKDPGSGQVSFHLTTVAAGNYIVKITVADKTYREKIVIW